jgi:UDP-N-acetylmuramyl pentapeptide phosphotransferase/UDP-N-acetylglucosamine-1-phosphate transferase
MNITFFIFILILFYTNKFFLQKKFLFDRTEFSKHKKFLHNKQIPVTGGIFLLVFLIFFFKNLSFQSYLYIFLIFITGFGSDRLKRFSPKLRLITQIILTLLFILDNNILINDVRISSLNYVLLNYELISVFFTIFCVVVLTNGTNFIDGINLNTIGYFIIIFTLILYLSNENNLSINFNLSKKIIVFLLFLYLLNYFNKIQLGDSGAYLLGFFSAFYIIEFINRNSVVSPYFAVLLFWYPCFENLFSIFEKKISKKKNFISR